MRVIASRLGLLVALVAPLAACAAPSASAPLASRPPPYGAPGLPPGAAPGGAQPWAFPSPAPLLFERPVNLAALLALQGRPAPRVRSPPAPGSASIAASRRSSAAPSPTFSLPRQSFASGPLPTSVDHRAEGSEGPIKSQGMVGACTAFSLSTAMDNAVRRMGRPDTISPLHVWSKYAVPVMGTAGDETLEKNITVEPAWPYDPIKACKLSRDPGDDCGVAYGVAAGSAAVDPQLRAEQGAADAGGRFRLIAIERLTGRPASTDELAAVLAGGDDVLGLLRGQRRRLDAALPPERGHPRLPDHQQQRPRRRPRRLPHVAHWTMLVPHPQQLGQRWGDQGYGWISDNMVRAYMRAAYKSGSATPEPPASPRPVEARGAAPPAR